MKSKPSASLHCPHCGMTLDVTPELYGCLVTCPACQGQFQVGVPAPDSAAAPGSSGLLHSVDAPPGHAPPAPPPPAPGKQSASGYILLAIWPLGVVWGCYLLDIGPRLSHMSAMISGGLLALINGSILETKLPLPTKVMINLFVGVAFLFIWFTMAGSRGSRP